MSKVKMIVTDLDGTLFTTEKRISKRAERAIRLAREKGVIFTIATGRNSASIASTVQYLGIKAPVIVGNGAFIHDDHRFYHKEVMSDKDIRTVMKVTEEFETSFYAFDERLIYCPKTPATEKATKIWLSTATDPNLYKAFRWFDTYDDVLKAVGGRTAKLLVIEQDLNKNVRVRTEIEKRCRVMIVNSEPANLDISNYGVSKGRALLELARHLGVKREDVLALGDGENDIELVENAGIGIAMGNAVESVKKKADFITLRNDDDGFAYAIEKFVLQGV